MLTKTEVSGQLGSLYGIKAEFDERKYEVVRGYVLGENKRIDGRAITSCHTEVNEANPPPANASGSSSRNIKKQGNAAVSLYNEVARKNCVGHSSISTPATSPRPGEPLRRRTTRYSNGAASAAMTETATSTNRKSPSISRSAAMMSG